ncbi:MAG TPA: GNAT family N-acetyltransferase [Acetobacteraceae bacterium]|nr:GNAT family N-acetyltransferase [Acetobacteraceae bacterium]
MSGADIILRDAQPADVPVIHRLVRALAEFEKLAHEMQASEADFAAALFGPRAHIRALIAEVAGGAAGFALWFYNFSTFTGRSGLYLEDIFVEPAHRGVGVGQAIFRELARRALAEGCARLEWSVLNWNENAIRFYRRIGAKPMDDWTVQRLSGPALAALAG